MWSLHVVRERCLICGVYKPMQSSRTGIVPLFSGSFYSFPQAGPRDRTGPNNVRPWQQNVEKAYLAFMTDGADHSGSVPVVCAAGWHLR